MNRYKLEKLERITKSQALDLAKKRKNDLVLREINVMVEASQTSLENFKHSRGFIPLELLEVTAKAIKTTIESIYKDTTIEIEQEIIDSEGMKEINFLIKYENQIRGLVGIELEKSKGSNRLEELKELVRKLEAAANEELTLEDFIRKV